MKKVKEFKNVRIAELSEAYNKILDWFFAFPTKEFGLNELSQGIRSSKTNTKRVINDLASEGFLKIEKLGNLLRISCNREHSYHLTRRVPRNLTRVYESGLVDFLVKEFSGARAIVLFGSYRKGDDTEESDIDIAVEVLDNQEPRVIQHGIIKEFGYRKDIKVNVLIFSRNKIDLNLFTNIVNGIVLWGLLEVIS